MQKINFQNLPSTTTPINATNLNAIQTNAETAINDVAGDLTDYVNGTTAMGDIKAGGIKFLPSLMGNLNLNDVGTASGNRYSQEIAIHNTGNVTNAPYTDEVAILKTYSWGGNLDWVVQEWFGLTSKRKYIREKSPNGWLNWERIYKATSIWAGDTSDTISNLPYTLTDFDTIEVFYNDETGRIGGSLRFKAVDGNAVCLTLTETESGFIVIKSGAWRTNGTSFEKVNSSFTQINHSNSIGGNNNPDWIHVVRIIGWN